MDRRVFLSGAGAALATPAIISSSQAQTRQLRVRRSVQSMAADDPFFSQYARAVEAMHALPESDRRSWRSQALIHVNNCVHGGQDFFHWHRHYITYFERLCGSLIGEPNFALAYWDWTANRGRMPDPFYDLPALTPERWRDRSDVASPNWNNNERVTTIGARGLAKGSGLMDDPQAGGAFDGIQDWVDNMTSFQDFTGSIEGQPHGVGHVVVGATPQEPSGHMSSGMSPLDPIFWLHHCNVDRLWEEWRSRPGHQTPVMGRNYNRIFVRMNGELANSVSSEAALNPTEMGFTYDTIQQVVASARAARSAAPAAPPVTRTVIGRAAAITASVGVEGARPVPVRGLTLPSAAASPSDRGARSAAPASAAALPRGRILVKLNDVRLDKDETMVIVNVFINCPYLTPTTPFTDKHFAGTFALFGGTQGHAAHARGASAGAAHGITRTIDATRCLQRLAQEGNIDLSNLKVQLMPLTTVRGARSNAKVTVGNVEVIRA